MFKALIVDDDRSIRYELKKSHLFGKNDFCITGEAGDGREALKKISFNDFDIAFVDIRMPKIDGIQLIQELRKCGNDLCVVIISGSGDYCYMRQAIRLGAFDYLLKPIKDSELDELLHNVSKFLNKKGETRIFTENTYRQLAESLKMPYSVQNEQELFKLIKESSVSAFAFSEKLALELSNFYEGDIFKLSIILENSYKNICRMLLSEMPWLNNLQFKELQVGLEPSEKAEVLVSAFSSGIKKLSELINNIHISSTIPVVKLLCEYIIRNVEGRTTLEEAAKALNYSSKYLGKVFREMTGESIVDYITKVKMERAKVLVLSGRYKTYEVSEIMGYKNTDYFTRLFKAHHGYTPLDIKRLSL